MMADLMDQDMSDQMLEIFFFLAPVIQQWAAIEIDHINSGRRVGDGFTAHIDAVIEAHQVERGFKLQRVQGLLVREILHAEKNVAQMVPERVGQFRQLTVGDRFYIVQAGGQGESGHGPDIAIVGP